MAIPLVRGRHGQRLVGQQDSPVPTLALGRNSRPRATADPARRLFARSATPSETENRNDTKIRAVIPDKSDQIAARKRKGRAGGRPPTFDEDAYKDRNVVERSFALVKQWRDIATRYDKLAITYCAAAVIHAALTWATPLGDIP